MQYIIVHFNFIIPVYNHKYILLYLHTIFCYKMAIGLEHPRLSYTNVYSKEKIGPLERTIIVSAKSFLVDIYYF